MDLIGAWAHLQVALRDRSWYHVTVAGWFVRQALIKVECRWKGHSRPVTMAGHRTCLDCHALIDW
jgi:hypothetical protein